MTSFTLAVLLLAPLASLHAAKVDFDLERGIYSLSMASETPVILDAHASVEGWASTDIGYKRRVIRKTAERILIECARADAPTLLLDFAKWAHTRTDNTAALEGYDPIGRRVDPGETYMPADSFYVDAGTANPFEALENYGRALREATGAKPNVYDFPTVCAWYAGVWKTGGAQDHPDKSAYQINTSSGMVEEAQKMKASGFLNYSRAAVRLVPDSYPTEPRSARPVDAFVSDGWPRVYDFAVTPDGHQVTLFNNTLPTREETIAA